MINHSIHFQRTLKDMPSAIDRKLWILEVLPPLNSCHQRSMYCKHIVLISTHIHLSHYSILHLYAFLGNATLSNHDHGDLDGRRTFRWYTCLAHYSYWGTCSHCSRDLLTVRCIRIFLCSYCTAHYRCNRSDKISLSNFHRSNF